MPALRGEPDDRAAYILFADIVGFTQVATSVSATTLVNLLNQIFSVFDRLSLKYGLEKIKTIGDAYMGVTNLVKDQVDHVKRIAAFSIDAIEAANSTLIDIDIDDPSKGYVEIRVGFHSGPCVANVVGSRSPR